MTCFGNIGWDNIPVEGYFGMFWSLADQASFNAATIQAGWAAVPKHWMALAPPVQIPPGSMWTKEQLPARWCDVRLVWCVDMLDTLYGNAPNQIPMVTNPRIAVSQPSIVHGRIIWSHSKWLDPLSECGQQIAAEFREYQQ